MGQHFVPQEYLRQFAVEDDPERIWMLDKSERSFKLLPIKSVAQAPGFYFDEDERALNERVEAPAHGPLKKLRDGEDVTKDERRIVAEYLQVLLSRVPKSRAHRHDLLRRELPTMVAKVEEELWESGQVPEQHRGLVTAVIDDWRTADPADLPDAELRELTERQWVLPEVVEHLCKMTWRILVSNSENAFLTSDNPFHYFEGFGLAHADAEVSVPLSSTVSLHASHQGQPETTLFIPAEPQLVKEINRRTASGADRFLFFHRGDRWVEKLAKVPHPRMNRIPWQSRPSARLPVVGSS